MSGGSIIHGFGQAFAHHGEELPRLSSDSRIKVWTSDSEEFVLDVAVAFMARRLRSIVETHGTDEVMHVPFDGVLFSRVVEYCTHYHDKYPHVDPLPIRFETLEACGASSWDVEFMATMTRDQFWEVAVAAQVLDIPGLTALCTTVGKMCVICRSSERLREEFSMLADIAPAEEERLAEMWDAARGKARTPLAEAAVFLHQVAAAGARIGVDVWGSDGIPGMSDAQAQLAIARAEALKPRSFRQASWVALVQADCKLLLEAPADIRSDPYVVLEAVQTGRGSMFRHATDALRSDPCTALWALELGGSPALEGALMPELAGDPKFFVEAVRVDGTALACASDALRADRSFVLDAVAAAAAFADQAAPARPNGGAGVVLAGAAQALRADPEFVLKCAEISLEAIRGASPELLRDRAFALEAVGRSGMALRYLSERFRADQEVVGVAVAQNGRAACFARTPGRAAPRPAAPPGGPAALPGQAANGPTAPEALT